MIRKIKYYLQIFPIMNYVSNWYEIILLYLFPKDEKVLVLKDKTKFLIKHHLDALTIKEIYSEDEYKISKMKVKTIIDIGTNIGTFSVLASKKHKNAKVFSFEPDPTTFKLLSTNLILNNCNNVKAVNTAIGVKNAKQNFYSHSASGLSSFTKSRAGMKKMIVNVITLESFMKKERISKCDFLKMDCEGAEYEILKSISKNLAKGISEMAIEYHDSITKYNHEDLIKMLKERGYNKIERHPHPLENDIGIIYATR